GFVFGTNSFTVSAWVRQHAVDGDPVLFGNKDWMSGKNPGWLLSARTNDWKYNANVPDGTRTDTEYPYSSAPGVTSIDEWNHLVISVDRAAETYTFYVNGQKYGKTTDFSANGHTDVTYDDEDMEYPFNIGEDGTGIINLAQVFDVDFDEVAVFLRALTDEEALALYTYAPAGYEAAVVAENPLLAPLTYTADGMAVRDSAEFYLSFDNGIQDDRGAYTVTKNGDVPTVEGVVGQAGHFADANYLTIDNYSFGTDSFTVSVWLNEHEIVNDPLILSNKDWGSGKNPGMAFAVESAKWIMNVNAEGSERADRKINTAEVAALCEDNFNTWTFITFVVDRDAHTITGYFNGRQIGDPVDFSENGHDGLVYADEENGYPLNIGNDGTGAYYVTWEGSILDADIDELAIFRKALTADEVAAMYASYGVAEAAPVAAEPVEKTLAVSQSELKAGDRVVVTATGEGLDWVGLYHEGDTPGDVASMEWYYTKDHNGEAYEFSPELDAGNYKVVLFANDGYDIILSADFTVAGAEFSYPSSGESGNLLVGKVIGNETGWGGNADAGAAAAFDGNPDSFFDPLGKGDGFCGMEFDSPKVLEKVVILSRSGWNARFNGARIDGSNDGENWTTLFQAEGEGT
ncbi:MAG: LamG domain-containing protein, partial [Firmicutes bacterium]|nr:LamG domain-containing protein [Bacillota bacterium]